MRQEVLGKHRGPKTIWDDKEELYAEFGDKDNFFRLLDELSWLNNWGAQAAAILRARHDGKTQSEVGDALTISDVSSLHLEVNALKALRSLRDRQLIKMGKVGEGAGGSIWRDNKGIMRKYGGLGEDYEKNFNNLLRTLELIEAPWAPDWGRRRARILRALMSGELQREVAENEELSRSRLYLLGYETLDILEALARGEEVGPARRGRTKAVTEFTNRYRSDIFWDLLDDFSWSGETWEERNQAGEGAAILRARAEGNTQEHIAEVLAAGGLQITRQRVEQIEAWALENLDRISRGEKIQFRRKTGRPRKN